MRTGVSDIRAKSPRTLHRARGTHTSQTVLRASPSAEVTLLDYGAGNVRSVRNALLRLGCNVKEVTSAQDISNAKKLLFPGVGSYGQAMDVLVDRGYVEPLKEYIELLFDGGDENGGVEGLGIISGRVGEFPAANGLPVPHIGWNTISQRRPSRLLASTPPESRVYFVHSYRAMPSDANEDWILATGSYGDDFAAVVNKGNVYATQFHPEKSGSTGLELLRSFLDLEAIELPSEAPQAGDGFACGLAKRVIACLDVRSNDNGDLVVTKGDQYDVREKTDARDVRNLGKPVELCGRYYQGGADEVTFLNITGFRDFPLGDLPMLEVLRQSSEGVFVPLTVGGGIRDFTDSQGKHYTALEVASAYFRSGADKVSIGGEAVEAALEYRRTGEKTGTTAIEQISTHYGKQAVVVSIDPKKVWEADPAACPHATVKTKDIGPNGEEYCWWQCTVKGGRETRDLGAVELAQAVQDLGAGEILLNNITCDGVGQGFDLELVQAVASAVTIPVIASSGAGAPSHFTDCFKQTNASAALAAGIFHRNEVSIGQCKEHMAENHIPTRR